MKRRKGREVDVQQFDDGPDRGGMVTGWPKGHADSGLGGDEVCAWRGGQVPWDHRTWRGRSAAEEAGGSLPISFTMGNDIIELWVQPNVHRLR